MQRIRQGVAIALSLAVVSSMAHAHGGMAGPDDLGPPLFTSGALALVCYWVVVLWPASKRKASGDDPGGRGMTVEEERPLARRSGRRAVPRRASDLRKIEGNRARKPSESGRKVSDV